MSGLIELSETFIQLVRAVIMEYRTMGLFSGVGAILLKIRTLVSDGSRHWTKRKRDEFLFLSFVLGFVSLFLVPILVSFLIKAYLSESVPEYVFLLVFGIGLFLLALTVYGDEET